MRRPRRPKSRLRRKQNKHHTLERLEQRLLLTTLAEFSLSSPIESEFVSSYHGLDFPGDRSDPEASARTFLSAASAALGMSSDTSDLRLIEVKQGLASSHTRLEQTLDGRPVHGADVSVHQGPDGSIQTLHTQYYSQIATPPAEPIISMEAAKGSAFAATGAKRLRSPVDAELVWYPLDETTVISAWRMTVSTAEPLGHFSTLVDAATGAVISQQDRLRFLTGTGFVFQPNPHQTKGNGIGLSDNADSNSSALTAQLIPVALEGLEPFSGLLKGEFADVATLNSQTVPDVDANEPSRVYEYTRSDSRFEQVVIYDTIDAMQRYIHSLGYDDDTGSVNGIRDFPTLANAHWDPSRGAFYDPANDAVYFLDGDVDAGEDADVIAHEYGHAIQFDQNSNFRIGGIEMDAMGEGFSDYWAASFFADQGDPVYQSQHAACIGEWFYNGDGPDDPPCVRRVDGDKIYPDDLVNIEGEQHANGEIWSRALWDIRRSLGGETADQLVLEHNFALPGNATMPVAAQALLDADSNLNGGVNSSAIRTVFTLRGMLSPELTPSSVAMATDVRSAGATVHTITVSYVDDIAIDVSELGDSDIRVSGPNGFEQFATLASVDFNTDGSPRVAEYQIAVPGGSWAEVDNGEYTISMVADEVRDTSGNAVAADKVGVFEVDIREAPSAEAIAADIVTEGATSHTIIVTYLDNDAIDVSDIGNGDIRVTGPNGFDQTGTFLSVNDGSDGRQRFARYTMAAPGGTWEASDNGLYTVQVVAGQVRDTSGNGVAGGSIGSFEVNVADNPTATASADPITEEGSATHTVSVTYFDNVAIDVSDIGDGDIRVTGPGGYDQIGTLLSIDSNTDGSPRVAQYSIPAPGGHWDQGDNGTYTITMLADQVRDVAGNAVLPGELGTFVVEVATIDGFGYEALVVAPTFEDIRSPSSRILRNEDDRALELSDAMLGDFEFELYGTTYRNLFVSSNGLITFLGPEPGFFNSELTFDPNQPTIAPLWDDLIVTDGVYWAVRGLGDEQRLIVQWEAEYLTGTNRISFQAILNEADGSIEFNYRDLAGNTAEQDEGLSATVGIKDLGFQGSNRLLLAFDSTANSFVGSGRSTRIQYGPSITLNLEPESIDESSGVATITAELSRTFQLPVTVDLGFSGSATLNDDYAVSAQQIVIPTGQTTGSVTLSTVQDTLDEADETVSIDVIGVANGTVTSPLPLTTTIIDDDDPPAATLILDATSIGEANGIATFTTVLSQPAGQDVTVDLAIDGTAVLNEDYTISATRIVIPTGTTTGSVTVTSTSDLIDEPDETLVIDIAMVTNAVETGVQQQTTTILDDDDPPLVTLAVDEANIPERHGRATFTATLAGPSSFPITVDLSTAGTATPTDDYVISGTQIMIAPGETSGSLQVTSVPDVLLTEGPETVTLEIAAVTNATEADVQQATTTIEDDTRGPAVTLSVDTPVIGEADGTATFMATLDLPSELPVTVDFGFSGTATQDVDYTLSGTQVVIAAGELVGSITVQSLQDSVDEEAEQVVVEVLLVTNGSETGSQSRTTTIADDDAVNAIGPTPKNGEFNVSASADVNFTFAEPVIADTVTAGTFVLEGQQSGRRAGLTYADGRIATRIPSQSFFAGEVVRATVTSDISTSAGAAVPHTWSFHTATTEGTGRFLRGARLDSDTNAVHLGDLDGDGDLDLFAGSYRDTHYVYLNDGNGVFGEGVPTFGDYPSRWTVLRDLDGDGDLDVFAANSRADQVYFNDGQGRFEDSGQSLATSRSVHAALEDLDGDGDIDVVVVGDGDNSVWLNDGVGNFTAGATLGNDDSEKVVLGDIDGDGDIDAFFADQASLSNPLWLNQGDGTFVDSGQGLPPVRALGDVDGDGDLDVYIGMSRGDEIDRIWLNDGGGVFTDSGQQLSSYNFRHATFADVDADADLDLLVASQRTQVWLNDGSGNYSDSGQVLANSSVPHFGVGDIDNDGDLDTVISQRTFNEVWLNEDQPASVTLSVDPMSVSEASGVATITASLNKIIEVPVTIDLALTGTATADSDYTVSATQVVVPAGSLSASANITAIQDVIDELDETVIVDIAEVINGEEAGTQQVTATILDDDRPVVTLAVDRPVINEAGGLARFTATLDAIYHLPVAVDLELSGRATRVADYNISATQIVIPAGESEGSVSVSSLSDADEESGESIIVDIQSVFNGSELGIQQQMTTIADDDGVTSPGPTPPNAALDVPAWADISFTYPDPVVPGSATDSTFIVHGLQSGLLSGTTFSADNTAIQFPSRSFFAGELVQATVTAGITTSAGAAAPYVWTFQAEATGGRGRFTNSGQSIDADSITAGVSLGDLDGDGDLDMFDASGANRIWMNDGNGNFSDSQTIFGTNTRKGAMGDLDGDGDLDLFIVGPNRIHLNDGSARFEDSGQRFPVGGGEDLELGDLDGDGDLDAILVDTTRRAWALTNDGAGTFTQGDRLGLEARSVTLADVDSDGDLDAMMIGPFVHTSHLWLNDGNGAFTDSGQTIPRHAALRDFDRDGDLDAHVWVTGDSEHNLWLNDGSGVFSNSGQQLSPTYGRRAFGDLDADGDLDVFMTTSQETGEVWVNDGLGTLSNSGPAIPLGTGRVEDVALSDVDNDGDLDAILVRKNPARIEVWLNENLPSSVTLNADRLRLSESSGIATLTLALDRAHTEPITVDLALSGTATADSDYTASTTQVVIPAGATSGTVTITPVDDLIDEPHETILVDIVALINGLESGSQQVSLTILDDDEPSFQVESLSATASGFVASFNNSLNASNLNLYDTQTAGLGPADITLVGSTLGPIAGSLVVHAATNSVYFVKTGGPLLPDTYNVTLRSATDGFTDWSGSLLDGNGDGVIGDDYTTTFTIAPPAASSVTVGIPDFVRGPGQAVNVPADSAGGIPVMIGPSSGVRAVDLRINYDPELLDITGANLGVDAPAGASVVLNNLTPGLAILVFFSITPLPTDGGTIINLTASVPTTDLGIYRKQQVLDVHSVVVSDGEDNESPTVADDAVHLADLFRGCIRKRPHQWCRRFATGARRCTAGERPGRFRQTPIPLLAADITGNGRLNAADAARVARFAALIPVPDIPPIPNGIRIPAGTGTPIDTLWLEPEQKQPLAQEEETERPASPGENRRPIYFPAVDATMADLEERPIDMTRDEELELTLEEVLEDLLPSSGAE